MTRRTKSPKCASSSTIHLLETAAAEADDPPAQAQLAALARLRVIGMEMADRIGALSAELAGRRPRRR